mmetsp:Transcript_30929/g.28114  ORF Transcript_30929/g.28114 Transcript_30929/m.28114 type:complete len:233 (-) Transcript_30929:504-1202(-)
MLEKTTRSILEWLNYNVLVNFINKFPDEIIEDDGAQLFEMIQHLTGKNLQVKAKFEGVNNRRERILVLHKQYDDLIRLLKENGALLNTIRPEYLLKYSDFTSFQKNNPSLHINSTQKMAEKNFRYLSTDAWVTLFFQILKIYYLGRVTLKNFKNVPGTPQDKLTIEPYQIEGSNLIGISESLLLRWLEIHYEKEKPAQPRRICNFDDDLRDCHIFSAVLQSFVGSNASKAFQ